MGQHGVTGVDAQMGSVTHQAEARRPADFGVRRNPRVMVWVNGPSSTPSRALSEGRSAQIATFNSAKTEEATVTEGRQDPALGHEHVRLDGRFTSPLLTSLRAPCIRPGETGRRHAAYSNARSPHTGPGTSHRARWSPSRPRRGCSPSTTSATRPSAGSARRRTSSSRSSGARVSSVTALLGWVYHALGRAWLRLDRLDEAQRMGHRALETLPGHPGFGAHAHHLLGDLASIPQWLDAATAEATIGSRLRSPSPAA